MWKRKESFYQDKWFIVKLQSKLNSLVQVRQGVDFVFPLSQEQEEEQEEQEQEEP